MDSVGPTFLAKPFLSVGKEVSFGTKMAFFPYSMWGVVFTACAAFLFFGLASPERKAPGSCPLFG
jgi:hypothetical protein